jgi:hypothetical protein
VEPARFLTRPRQSLSAGIFLTLFFAYLFTTSRERPWADATAIYQVAESLVDHHRVDIPTRWPYTAAPGRDGRFYAANPLLTSLVHLPAAYLHHKIVTIWPSKTHPRLGELSVRFLAHLGPAALGALAGLLFFLLCLEHGIGTRAATLATLGVGFASTAWVYARSPYSEALQMACFTGAFLYLTRIARAESPTRRTAMLLGLWTGLLVDSKTVYLAALPAALLYLVWRFRRDWRALGRVIGWTCVTFLPLFSLYFVYNWWRYGSLTSDGYTGGGLSMLGRGEALVGLWGMFLSPGKSVFLYSPIILLGLFGLRALIQRAPRTAVLMAVATLPVVLFTARLPSWHGDYAWGPRYLVFAVPVMCLPAAFAIERALAAGPALRRAAALAGCGAILLAGFVVQVAGNAFYWDHWIRLSGEARAHWLGVPDRGGATVPDAGGICHSCFEDLHQLHWLPQFQPIRGHLWLLRHVPRHDSWRRAEADAPWHPETTLQLDIAASYNRARIDWWLLEYDKLRKAGVIMGLTLLSGMLAGVLLWWRGLRPRRTERATSTAGGVAAASGPRTALPPESTALG